VSQVQRELGEVIQKSLAKS